jgi:hypothetical protein
MDLPKTLCSSYNSSEDRYECVGVDDFVDPGAYQVFYFAKDDISGNVSPLVEGRVYKAKEGNNAPGIFELIEPYDEEETATKLPLMWEDSIDPDGDPVSYTLQIAMDQSFTDIYYQVEGIIDNYYFAGAEAGLEDLTTYYWRVTAVDQYGAQTVSVVRSLSTNNTNGIPGYLIGLVVNSLGQGIGGATVGTDTSSASTHVNGTYMMSLPSGSYYITASKTGYYNSTKSGVSVQSGGYASQSFKLTLIDYCPDDPDKMEPGICGCGVADVDTDSDGTMDCNDSCPNDPNKTLPSTCGCGVADMDTDSDGTMDCNDSCPSDPDKTVPGACGCGIPDTDTDNDGIADCNDDDDDNDGFTDEEENIKGIDPLDPASHPPRAMPWLPLLLE